MQARIATKQLFPATIPVRVNFDRDLEVDRKSPENFQIAFRIRKPNAFKMNSVPGQVGNRATSEGGPVHPLLTSCSNAN
jgi:hypothetical protein